MVLLVCASALVAEGKWTFTPSGASTVSGTLTDGNWTFTLEGKSTGGVTGGSMISAVSAGSGDLDLTGVYDDTGIKLVSINNYVYFSSKGITSLKTGSYFRTLGNGVFQNCSDLQTVELNEGLTSIGDATFSMQDHSTRLRRVVLPSTLSSIARNGFYGTTNLTEIIPFLPPSFSSFGGEDIFRGCAVSGRLSLTNKNLTAVKARTFYSCSHITEVDFSDSLTTIGDSAFAFCSSLTNLVNGLPASLTSASSAFSMCTKLPGTLDMSKCTSLRSIPDSFINGCESLEEIVLPPGVTNFVKRTFRKCSKLKRVVASAPGEWRTAMKTADGRIGKEAFDGVGSLGSVEIPWGGTTVFADGGVLAGTSLTNVWFFGEAPAKDGPNVISRTAYKCTFDVSKQADEAGWRALGRDLTEAEKAKADKPEGRVFGIVEKPAGREAWLRWKASPLYPSGLILLMR